ncbi:MAG: hypothetical protein RR620_08490 [Clostridium sp.]
MNVEDKPIKNGSFRRTFYLKKEMQIPENDKAVKWLEGLDDFSKTVMDIVKKYVDGDLLERSRAISIEEYQKEIDEKNKLLKEKELEIKRKQEIIEDIQERKNKLEDSLNLQINLFNSMVSGGNIAITQDNNMSKDEEVKTSTVTTDSLVSNIELNEENQEIAIGDAKDDEVIATVITDEKFNSNETNEIITENAEDIPEIKPTRSGRMKRGNLSATYKGQI